MPDSGQKIVKRLLLILLAAFSVAGTGCVTLDRVKSGSMAVGYLPEDAEVAIYADFALDPGARKAVGDMLTGSDRETIDTILERCEILRGAFLSMDPQSGVFVLYGNYSAFEMNWLLSRRPGWTKGEKGWYDNAEEGLSVAVPVSGLLVIRFAVSGEYTTVSTETGTEDDIYSGATGEVLALKAVPRESVLPVTGAFLWLYREADGYRLSGRITPSEGMGFLLLTGFKGYLAMWARRGDDPLFSGSYRRSSLTISEAGDLVIENLYFADPWSFLWELAVPGVNEQ